MIRAVILESLRPVQGQIIVGKDANYAIQAIGRIVIAAPCQPAGKDTADIRILVHNLAAQAQNAEVFRSQGIKRCGLHAQETHIPVPHAAHHAGTAINRDALSVLYSDAAAVKKPVGSAEVKFKITGSFLEKEPLFREE
ncbi:hypothetical protein BMS3Abin05_00794 [bacterium BMS3Abin05]|nr:hypothetical protein BMS3Abin05_00794 [bacterium BMS3Abin05]